jgi:hypothetical protein
VDTAFDPNEIRTIKVAFLSDDYFTLVAADAQLRAAFAQGAKVIALTGGVAYEVVEADSPVPAVEIPEPGNLQSPGEPAAPTTSTTSPEDLASASEAGLESPAEASNSLCVGGVLPLALFPLVGILVIRRSSKYKNRI